MLIELKTFVVKCDGCGTMVKVQEEEPQFAVPGDWHIETPAPDGYYCDNCYVIKDVIE